MRIRHATAIGARITNSSFGVGFAFNAIKSAYNDTFDLGVAHFASAGNGAQSPVTFPASLPTVMAVGALDSEGLIALFTNIGFNLDFVAPGVDIFTTDRTGFDGYNCCQGDTSYTITAELGGVDGTSYASPFAAGVAALLLARNRNLTPAQIRDIMQDTAVDITPFVYGFGFDEFTGHGLINAAAALGAVPDFVVGDLNADMTVDGSDLSILLQQWGEQSLHADLTGDGTVDGADLGILLANWGP